ncbi:RHOMBOID-like protein 12, mitochondrial isoform X2 [Salvia miltiorrhiza]|uniref:RHOMBOID-like protein 12, mitochondrial isoform X2 n=1 Tax=Salvia miltiorrhiza TaxID=226208 RepID=UPI0025AD423E|nr:RHOMBOID-like protein 12, mitochondrial isoform X2 [Salvia miltiorrhiza]
MRRQLGVGLLTKIARNGPSINVISPKSASLSSFLNPNSTPFHHRSLLKYSTLSRSHLWKICSPNGLRGSIQNGAFPTSLVATRFFSNALLQGRPKFPVTFLNRRSLSSFSPDSRWISFFRRFIPDRCVVLMIVTNTAVFMLWKVADTDFMIKNFMISVQHIKCGLLYTFITSAFSHIKTDHLIANMLIFSIFGTRIARKFGPQYLLKLYLGGATAGSIFYLVFQAFVAPSVEVERPEISHSDVSALGASAAVNAIVLLDVLLFPPVPVFLVGVFIIGRDMLSWKKERIEICIFPGVRVVREYIGDREVSGSPAHLGGFMAGGFAWLWTIKGRFPRF